MIKPVELKTKIPTAASIQHFCFTRRTSVYHLPHSCRIWHKLEGTFICKQTHRSWQAISTYTPHKILYFRWEFKIPIFVPIPSNPMLEHSIIIVNNLSICATAYRVQAILLKSPCFFMHEPTIKDEFVKSNSPFQH